MSDFRFEASSFAANSYTLFWLCWWISIVHVRHGRLADANDGWLADAKNCGIKRMSAYHQSISRKPLHPNPHGSVLMLRIGASQSQLIRVSDTKKTLG